MDFIMSSEPINKIIAYCWAYVIPYSIVYIGGMGGGTNWSVSALETFQQWMSICVCGFSFCIYCTVSPGSCTWRVCLTLTWEWSLASTYCEWHWQELCHCNPFQAATDSALRPQGCSFHLSGQPPSKRERDAARDQELRSWREWEGHGWPRRGSICTSLNRCISIIMKFLFKNTQEGKKPIPRSRRDSAVGKQ